MIGMKAIDLENQKGASPFAAPKSTSLTTTTLMTSFKAMT